MSNDSHADKSGMKESLAKSSAETKPQAAAEITPGLMCFELRTR
ncbi:hypothetical protein Hdeb2414_s0026g00679251 [Helianthus debilis subsp. tardiflorus]